MFYFNNSYITDTHTGATRGGHVFSPPSPPPSALLIIVLDKTYNSSQGTLPAAYTNFTLYIKTKFVSPHHRNFVVASLYTHGTSQVIIMVLSEEDLAFKVSN